MIGAHFARTRMSTLMPEINATSFPVLATRTPMCHCGRYPGAVRALGRQQRPRRELNNSPYTTVCATSRQEKIDAAYQSKNSFE